MMRAFKAWLAVLALLPGGVAAAEEDLLAAIAAANPPVTTLAGTATRAVTRIERTDDRAEVSLARFAVAVPDRYWVVLTKPDDPDGERHTFKSDGATTWEIQQAGPDFPADRTARRAGETDADFRRLLASLRLDLAALGKDYRLEPARTASGAALTLLPSSPAAARTVSRLVIELDAALRPRRVVLDQPDGNRTRLDLGPLDRAAVVADADFRGDR